MMMKKILVICGPTASGKSTLAVDLALKYGGQVISCDAMQIYRGMDIGTGKVGAEEMRGVRHRMLDIADPSENFSLAGFIDRARREIDETLTEGALPILCGGTGLYLDRLLDGTALSEATADDNVRAELEKRTSEELFSELLRVDPASAAATHQNNRKRVIRALEIYRVTGMPKSVWDERSHNAPPPYDALRILLLPGDRQALYDRIDARVDAMFAAGLENEARALFADSPSTTAAQAIGYKEFLPYFAGEQSLDEVKNAIKQASRNYAKRQLTWFKRTDSVVIDCLLTEEEKIKEAERAVKEFL